MDAQRFSRTINAGLLVAIVCGLVACSDDASSDNDQQSDTGIADDVAHADVDDDASPSDHADTNGEQTDLGIADDVAHADVDDDAGSHDAGPNDDEPTDRFDYDESAYDDYVDTSRHYRFPLDDEGWAVIEPAADHQTYYVAEDGDDANDGTSDDAPLATIDEARNRVEPDSSDRILLQRGDRFDTDVRMREEFSGASPDHPMVLGAYGEGPRPVIEGALRLWSTHRHIAIVDVAIEQVGKYCLDVLGEIENLFVENMVTIGCESRIQGDGDNKHVGVTLRRSMILDAHFDEPRDDADDWSDAHGNRISGIYVANVDGLFIEESYADKNGWRPGYDVDAAAGPHPPSMFSHNFYLQSSNENLVFRGNLTARAGSAGAQIRPGGVVQRNAFVQNNDAGFTGSDDGASLVEDNVVTIAGNKEAHQIGARGWGFSTHDVADTVLRRNIVAHSTDPQGPEPDNDYANNGLAGTDGVQMEDNVVYQWGSDDQMPAELPAGIEPDEVSLAAYAASHLDVADLDALHDALRARDRGDWPRDLAAPSVAEYFAHGFGVGD